MRKNCNAEVRLTHDLTVEALQKILAPIPADAKVSVRVEKYYNQFDAGGKWLKFNWTEEV